MDDTNFYQIPRQNDRTECNVHFINSCFVYDFSLEVSVRKSVIFYFHLFCLGLRFCIVY